jgi:hypothetical protein
MRGYGHWATVMDFVNVLLPQPPVTTSTQTTIGDGDGLSTLRPPATTSTARCSAKPSAVAS